MRRAPLFLAILATRIVHAVGSRRCDLKSFYSSADEISLDEFEHVDKELRDVLQTNPPGAQPFSDGCHNCMSSLARASRLMRFQAADASCSMGTEADCHDSSAHVTLLLPFRGGSFGEWFETNIYPAYAAVAYLVDQVLGGAHKPNMRAQLRRNISIIVLLEGGSKQQHQHPAAGQALQLCHNSSYWPAGWLGPDPSRVSSVRAGSIRRHNVPSSTSRIDLNLSDGTVQRLNFPQTVHASCTYGLSLTTAATASHALEPGSVRSETFTARHIQGFMQAWGVHQVQISPLPRGDKDRPQPRCLRHLFIQIPRFYKSFFQEGSRSNTRVFQMFTQVKRFYLPPIRATPFHAMATRADLDKSRDGLTILSRQCHLAGTTCCICKRVWLNEEEAVQWLAAKHSSRRVRAVELEGMALRRQVELFDETAVLIGLHGSAMINAAFLHYSSVAIEIWPLGYFGAKDTRKYENVAASAGVTYLKTEALSGNFYGHDAWTFVPPQTQLGPLVELALQLSSNIKQPFRGLVTNLSEPYYAPPRVRVRPHERRSG